jgi:hypothetical protein
MGFNAYSSPNVVGSTTLTANQWYHVAATRSGTTLRVFVDGVLDGTVTGFTESVNGVNSQTVKIGSLNYGSGSFNGYMDDFRVIRGKAIYTNTFTPPAAELTATGSFVGSVDAAILLHVDSSTPQVATMVFADDSGTDRPAYSTATTVKDENVSNVKFGSASAKVTSGNAPLSITNNISGLGIETNSLTIEMWAKLDNLSGSATVFSFAGSNSDQVGYLLQITSLGELKLSNNAFEGIWGYGSTNVATSSGAGITAGTWNHYAVVYSVGAKRRRKDICKLWTI